MTKINYKWNGDIYPIDTILPRVGDIVETICSGVHTYVKVTEIVCEQSFRHICCDEQGVWLTEKYPGYDNSDIESKPWDIFRYPITKRPFAEGHDWNRII